MSYLLLIGKTNGTLWVVPENLCRPKVWDHWDVVAKYETYAQAEAMEKLMEAAREVQVPTAEDT